jgi:hypothetical protein
VLIEGTAEAYRQRRQAAAVQMSSAWRTADVVGDFRRPSTDEEHFKYCRKLGARVGKGGGIQKRSTWSVLQHVLAEVVHGVQYRLGAPGLLICRRPSRSCSTDGQHPGSGWAECGNTTQYWWEGDRIVLWRPLRLFQRANDVSVKGLGNRRPFQRANDVSVKGLGKRRLF